MSLILLAAFLTLSLYLIAKGVQMKVDTTRKLETDTARNRWLALLLIVLGLAIGFGYLYWTGGVTLIKQAMSGR